MSREHLGVELDVIVGAMPPEVAVPEQVMDLEALIVGELDRRFRAIAAEMHAALPDSVVVTVAGAGHAAHVECPDDVAAAIRELT